MQPHLPVHPSPKLAYSYVHSPLDRRAELLANHFFSRYDKVALATRHGTPRPQILQNLENILKSHLSENGTRVGSYTPNEDGTTAWLCLDFDGKGSGTKKGKGHSAPLEDPKAAALHAYAKLIELGFTPYLELSGSGQGWHVWVFFSPRVPAIKARVIGYAAVPMDAPLVGGGVAEPHSAKGIEVFPKQNSIKKGGYGNMVWLPWFEGNVREGRNTFWRPETNTLNLWRS